MEAERFEQGSWTLNVNGLVTRVQSVLPAGLMRAGFWGLLDQALISGTNFASMIIAARYFGPATFGVFALLVTILSFMEASQRSLITTPHNVFGVNKSVREYTTHTSTTLALQVCVAIILGALSLLAAIVVATFDRSSGYMVAAMALAAVAWQLHEFTRRVCYTESRIPVATLSDSVAYPGRLAAIAVIAATGLLSGPMLMLTYAGAWFAGSLTGIWGIRKSITRAFDVAVIAEHLQFGRWLFLSNAISNMPRYVVATLLASVLSISAYGAYRDK